MTKKIYGSRSSLPCEMDRMVSYYWKKQTNKQTNWSFDKQSYLNIFKQNLV